MPDSNFLYNANMQVKLKKLVYTKVNNNIYMCTK